MRVDLVLTGGDIRTQDPDRPATDRLAVLGGRVVALGSDVDGLDARERIDVGGRTVLPGFNDAHAHSVWFGMTLTEVDLSGARSLDAVYDAIDVAAAGLGPREWLIASGYNPAHVGGAHPDRAALDRAAGGRPVWIKHASGHSCQVNGVALARIGLGSAPPADLDGGRVLVGRDGRPNGVLEERAMGLVRDVVLPYSVASIERALDLATAQYAREGLTSVTDCGVAGGWIGHADGELAGYQAARDHGVLRTRMQVMPVLDALSPIRVAGDEPDRLGLRTGVRTGWGDATLRLGPVKIFTDGSILGRTAQMRDEYDGCPGEHGYLQEDPDVLRARVLAAAAAGWSLALHAVGDAALDLALDLIEEAQRRHGRPSVPNRVEHGAVVRAEQLERLAALGAACVVQPGFIPAFGEDMRRAVGPERARLSHRARSQLEAGLPLGLSSDRPVAPGAPLRGIQAFVERMTEAGLPYGPSERLTPEEAVRAATLGSARVTGAADRGRLIEGGLADLVVLDAHPADVPVADIHAIPVIGTAVGGVFTHRADVL